MIKYQEKNKIVIYKSKSGHIQLDVKLEKETIWLTQKQIAELFDVSIPTINEHLSNIYNKKAKTTPKLYRGG